MTYVCSDIHGCYDSYLNMLDEIGFYEDDMLYILGDVLDRGDNGGIDILLNIMDKPNIKLILGNHEEVALDGMEFLMGSQLKNVSDVADLPEYVKVMLLEWMNLGGLTTIDAFRQLASSEQKRIVHFLSDRCLTYEELSVNGTDYVLCHDESYFGDVVDGVLITGHTPTRYLDDNPNPDFIWRDGEHWHIDCGSGYGGQLGAICLETGKEFYVD